MATEVHMKELEAIALTVGNELQTKVKQFAEESVKRLRAKLNPEDFDDWKHKLQREDMEKRKQIERIIDSSTEKAMEKIERMPDPVRAQADDGFVTSQDYLMDGARKLIEFLDKSWNVLLEIWSSVLAGRDAPIEEAVRTINEWAEETTRALSGARSKASDAFKSVF